MILFPDIDPVAFTIIGFPIRWYALAYITGLVLGMLLARYLVQQRHLWGTALTNLPKAADIEILMSWIAVGIILGGRLGYVLFYQPDYYFSHPLEILKVWQGGMSFHGGLIGVAAAIAAFAYAHRPLSFWRLADIVAISAPIGLLFGRIANFINGELYGRVTDVAWAMRFPTPHGWTELRHPSQLYEAGTEGLLLFLWLLYCIFYKHSLKNPGKITAKFLIGYGIARIFCEFWREPDTFLGFITQIANIPITQGMILSLPLIMIGSILLWRTSRIPSTSSNPTASP